VSGEDARVIALKVERGEVKPLVEAAPEVPREVAGLVHRAMAARPELRFASATEMRLAVDAVTKGKRAATGAMPAAHAPAPAPAPATTPPAARGGTSMMASFAAASTDPAPTTERTLPTNAMLGPPMPYAPMMAPAYGAPPPPRKRKSSLVWLITIPLLLGAAVAAVIVAMQYNDDSPPPAPAPTAPATTKPATSTAPTTPPAPSASLAPFDPAPSKSTPTPRPPGPPGPQPPPTTADGGGGFPPLILPSGLPSTLPPIPSTFHLPSGLPPFPLPPPPSPAPTSSGQPI
jgi:hypothetical protein